MHQYNDSSLRDMCLSYNNLSVSKIFSWSGRSVGSA
jgi:hypothetical protein